MKRVWTGLLATAMTAGLTATASAFPTVMVKDHEALVCRYLLSSRILTYSKLKHEPVEMTKLPQCFTIPKGTKVLAEDTDGGDFIGITLPGNKNQAIWWTYQGWFTEATP
jgi:hypothetical protein